MLRPSSGTPCSLCSLPMRCSCWHRSPRWSRKSIGRGRRRSITLRSPGGWAKRRPRGRRSSSRPSSGAAIWGHLPVWLSMHRARRRAFRSPRRSPWTATSNGCGGPSSPVRRRGSFATTRGSPSGWGGWPGPRARRWPGGGSAPAVALRRPRDKTGAAIRQMAAELLDLYARRQLATGFAFPPDTPWQRELESAFLYEDTPDQRRASEEVKRDMERARPMDRLLVGDVGYGKTEVALRAAFKAVQAGKQVAVLVPTTILAEQHGRTFRERLADYPVRIEVLSRFRGPKDTEQVTRRLETGEVDVVIGTHRLLSRDVRFHDLRLLIVDEEHRFGVRHKERRQRL